jgi:SAM-dependent methyltransferase
MMVDAMRLFGRALQAYLQGDTDAELVVRRDDGQATPVPVCFFFRDGSELTPVDRAALERCTGRVLDVGAGTGLHSLLLQRKGLAVTALDISPQAVEVMKRRGVTDARCADVFEFRGGEFDTMLLLCHGIGMVETLDGLDRFLAHARHLLVDGGQVLVDSLDVRNSKEPADMAYHDANQREGRYRGEIRMRFEFRGGTGPYCGWLHVDAQTLGEHAESAGWRCEVVHQEASGEYLARLS